MVNAARSLKEIEAEIELKKKALEEVKGTATEVYARIVGYYRSVRNWNKGKRDEYDHRKVFVYDDSAVEETSAEPMVKAAETPKQVVSEAPAASYEFFARKTCPNCPPVKNYIAGISIPGTNIDVDTEEGLARAAELGVFAAPTVILYDANGVETARAHNVKELEAALKTTSVPVLA